MARSQMLHGTVVDEGFHIAIMAPCQNRITKSRGLPAILALSRGQLSGSGFRSSRSTLTNATSVFPRAMAPLMRKLCFSRLPLLRLDLQGLFPCNRSGAGGHVGNRHGSNRPSLAGQHHREQCDVASPQGMRPSQLADVVTVLHKSLRHFPLETIAETAMQSPPSP